MVTRMVRAVTGTLAIAGVLAGCASAPTPPPAAPTPPTVAAMVARHPGCASLARVESDGGVSCAVEGHLYLLYVYGDATAAQDAARMLRTLHTTGTVDVDGADVWVTE